jgi:SAM-dependent methyltransferase
VAALDDLLREAAALPVGGWDIDRLDDRITVQAPWSYDELVRASVRRASSLLDIGTGGGEWLAGYEPRPPLTVATESWAPNVTVAARRLRPLGAHVVHAEAAADNEAQDADPPGGRLPFAAGAFEAVVDRNEAFVASEVLRVLAPGGSFVTEQAGPGCDDDLHELLGLPAPRRSRWDAERALAQLAAVGDVAEAHAGAGVATRAFADVGALAWWLRMVPWAVPGFEIGRFRDRLAALHAAGGPYVVREPRFWVTARRR